MCGLTGPEIIELAQIAAGVLIALGICWAIKK